ncbi:MAG: hypothetical protein ALAOOOJD_03950 [bacterium]|nr:hypothetical protein [bacterium]
MKKSAFISISSSGCVIALMTFFLPPVLASHYYVASTGNNSNAGSINSPWATISFAVSKTRHGDTIFVRGGHYTEGEIWIRDGHGNATGKFLVISAYPGETPVFTNGNRGLIIDIPFVRVEGLTFMNGKSLYSLKEITNHEYIHNTFTGSGYGWDAISVAGKDILVEGNVINLLGNTAGTQGHGIYVHASSNVIIRNNRISGMTGYAIHIFDQWRSGDAPGYARRISNVVVEGNVLFGSRERAGIIVSAYDQAKVEKVAIRNNIVYRHAGSGIVVRDDVSDIKIYNNTIYDVNTDGIAGNGAEGIYVGNGVGKVTNVDIRNNVIVLNHQGTHIVVDGASSVMVDHNLYWPPPPRLKKISDANSRVANPVFVNEQANDFRLKASSPAIDTGVSVGLPFHGAAPDLGAFEYTGSAAGRVDQQKE